MTSLKAGDLSLNEVLERLGYQTVRHQETARHALRRKSVRKDKKAVRFPEGTIPGRHAEVTSLESTTADIVWKYLRAKGEIK